MIINVTSQLGSCQTLATHYSVGDYLLTYVSIHLFFIHDEINIEICGV